MPNDKVVFIKSKRGTHLLVFDGNPYTPNEKLDPNEPNRSWKCCLYYKNQCKARLRTYRKDGYTWFFSKSGHNHIKKYPGLSIKDSNNTDISNSGNNLKFPIRKKEKNTYELKVKLLNGQVFIN